MGHHEMTDERLRELYQRHQLALAARGASEAGGRCPAPEAVLALVRREGPEEERLATLDHVMSCPDCRRELDLLRAIEAAGATAGVAAGDSAQPSRSRDRPAVVGTISWRRAALPLALAASLLLAVGVGVRGRFGGADADVVRGDASGGGTPALVAPAAGADVAAGAPLTFTWRSDPDARRYLVEVLDASGRAVVTESTTDTTLAVRDAARLTRLAPGAEYRWWVRAVLDGGAQRASAVRPLRVRASQ